MIFVYFLVGLFFDYVITLDTQAVINKKIFRTFFYSFLITVIGVSVIAEITLSTDRWLLVLSYALGAGTGSALAVHKSKGGTK